jgi:type II secretory ATPase GspE/PulE/Tfp pilus assembly ATPase PilB-like protein
MRAAQRAQVPVERQLAIAFFAMASVGLLASEIFELPVEVKKLGFFFATAGVLTTAYDAARTFLGRIGRAEEPHPVASAIVLDAPAARFVGSLAPLDEAAAAIERENEASRIDAVSLVHTILSAGFASGASDVHLTPESGGLRVIARVDGVLHELGVIATRHVAYVVNRVKIAANLSIDVRLRPQDGRLGFDDPRYQVRVATLPTNHGEKVVMRLAVNDESRYALDRIGLDGATLVMFKTMLERDHGVIYLTGPTGSGKTTTMYAAMRHLRDGQARRLNLVTLEDPLEVDFQGMSQTEVNARAGLSFAAGLRSILRQDPDVIMLGEIRDEETAQTCIRAGLTGHLLLTSVHADSAVGVFQRMRQLHVDVVQLAGASLGVLNQRLAVRNCPHCTQEVEPNETFLEALRHLEISAEGPFFEGAGCPACRGVGRKGRVPLIELLQVDGQMRDLLVNDAPMHKIEEAAIESGMRPLSEQALALAREGVLPPSEVVRVLAF